MGLKNKVHPTNAQLQNYYQYLQYFLIVKEGHNKIS
jgi:hypothetical protein